MAGFVTWLCCSYELLKDQAFEECSWFAEQSLNPSYIEVATPASVTVKAPQHRLPVSQIMAKLWEMTGFAKMSPDNTAKKVRPGMCLAVLRSRGAENAMLSVFGAANRD